SYQPNLSGVQWFIKECWPRIKREIPNARLRLAGKDTDGLLKPIAPDVDALGWLTEPAEEIATWSAMIIPLRFGAGTRIKIADAFSRKCPVVSTRLGAFGYDVQNGRELLLADSPAEFAAACVSLVRDPAQASAMAERAFAGFLEKWTWEAIAPRVKIAAEDALGRAGRRISRELPRSQGMISSIHAGARENARSDQPQAIKFSVIIPTFNRAKYVQFAIKSALSQKCSGLEVIVVDDGSEDDTASVLKNSNLDIKYIYQKNQGVSSARNRGIREAVGEWVAFLDSDDEWHPDYLSRQEELVGKYHSARSSVLNGEDRSDPQNVINKDLENGMIAKFGGQRDILVKTPFLDVVRHHITTLDCCIFHRKTLLATRLFDESLSIGEDHDIILQMALMGPFAFCNDIGALIYRREESIMNLSAQLYKSGLKARLCWARVFERFLQNGQLLESEREAVRFKYSRNQRALGNLYLRIGDKVKAQESYKQAWDLRPSIESAARLGLSYLPCKAGKLFLHKEGNVSPGFARTST
ncbi:MAG TPA: glycosyltransferase, partial [Verrucomicrobiae bacterium]|nr:glycosyltransferase [Verrucomicrobiae bacterium]